jgi:hypothetical protein
MLAADQPEKLQQVFQRFPARSSHIRRPNQEPAGRALNQDPRSSLMNVADKPLSDEEGENSAAYLKDAKN